jgi:ferredoxin/coenzyme F420-reducing hydrogenase delta subunit
VSPRRALRRGFEWLDALCARSFPPSWNPLVQLGALGWLFFWIVAVSGLYLYIFFDTGVVNTYASVERITHEQWWAGGIMRSLHRYASDALVVVAFVHLLREWAMDRMRGNHWFAWVTGIVLLVFIYVCGITGYWLVWDELAQYVAQATSEWLDFLKIFGEPVSRNFLNPESLSDRFFTLMVLIHIAAPLLMLLFMWVHISRHAAAKVNPARGLGMAVTGALLVLSLVHPALSHGPADLGQVPAVLSLDWFYLALYPLMQLWGSGAVWGVLLASGLLLLLLPWLPPRRTPPAAMVSLPNCNGCARCYDDCPFGAISLVPRSDGLPYEQQASVDPARCMSCGICVGACPTATPLRTAGNFVAGIELPQLSLEDLRRRVRESAARLRGPARVMVFACGHGAPAGSLAGDGVAVFELPCVGMLPPPFIDFILSRDLADGVMLAGCAPGDCYHRLGDRWTEARIAGERDPWLRPRVARERVAVSWAGSGEVRWRSGDLAAFCERLAGLPRRARGASREHAPATRLPRPHWALPVRWAGQALVLGTLTVATGALASWPQWRQLAPDEAVLHLSFSHAALPKVECKPLTVEEMMQLKPNMRRQVGCPRERWPVLVELERDGELLYRGRHEPAGLWNDGPSTVFERFPVPAGEQTLTVRLRDSGRDDGFDHERTERVSLEPGQSLVVQFRTGEGFIIQ